MPSRRMQVLMRLAAGVRQGPPQRLLRPKRPGDGPAVADSLSDMLPVDAAQSSSSRPVCLQVSVRCASSIVTYHGAGVDSI